MLQYKIVIFIAVFHSQTRPSGNGQGWASCRCVCGQWNKTTAEKAVCKGWIPKSESLHCCLVRDSEAVHNSVFRLWSGKLYSKAEKVLNVPRIRKKGKKKERSVKTSLNSLALHNARTFKSLSLRVRCIWVPLFLLLIVD